MTMILVILKMATMTMHDIVLLQHSVNNSDLSGKLASEFINQNIPYDKKPTLTVLCDCHLISGCNYNANYIC